MSSTPTTALAIVASLLLACLLLLLPASAGAEVLATLDEAGTSEPTAPTSAEPTRLRPVPGRIAEDIHAEVIGNRLIIIDNNAMVDSIFGGVLCAVDTRGCTYGRSAAASARFTSAGAPAVASHLELDAQGHRLATLARAHRQASARVSTTPVVWFWGQEAGEATLVRHPTRLTATWTADAGPLTGKAMTLWFVVFNHPEACTGGPGVPRCTDDDLFTEDGDLNHDVAPDFLFADGLVTEGGTVELEGTVHRNGRSGITDTGLGELICVLRGDQDPTCEPEEVNTPGLTDPRTAEVHLVLHNHGDALEGAALQDQLSTFLGGCAGAPAPFPESPDTFEECQSIQLSIHQEGDAARAGRPTIEAE